MTSWTTVALAGVSGAIGLLGGLVAAWLEHRSSARRMVAEWRRADAEAQRAEMTGTMRDLLSACESAIRWRDHRETESTPAREAAFDRLVAAAASAELLVEPDAWSAKVRPYVVAALSASAPPGRMTPVDFGPDEDVARDSDWVGNVRTRRVPFLAVVREAIAEAETTRQT